MMSKVAMMVVTAAAALGCNVEASGNNCGNVGDGDGGAGGQASSVLVGGGGSGGGGVPLKATVPVECGGFAMTDPGADSVTTTLEMPQNSGLRWIEVQVTPPQAHLAPPVILPRVEFMTAPHGEPPVFTTLALSSDLPSPLSVYETPHKVTLTVAPSPGLRIDNSGMLYAARGTGESGGGAKMGTVFAGWTCFVELGGCDGVGDGIACGIAGVCVGGSCVES